LSTRLSFVNSDFSHEIAPPSWNRNAWIAPRGRQIGNT
jgi:hypothetical protein